MGHLAIVNADTIQRINSQNPYISIGGTLGAYPYKTISDLFADALTVRDGDIIFTWMVNTQHKEGIGFEDSRCEYMLAWLYYKKSLDMYTSLADKDYEDSKDILNKIQDLKIDLHKSLIGKFELKEEVDEDDEYVPIYLLDIKENLDSLFEDSINDMIIEK